jgi:hypothetical protein
MLRTGANEMSLYTSYNPLVDWITATAREDGPGQQEMYELARGIADEFGKQYGYLTDDWYFHGYNGFIVRGHGHVSYGERAGQGSIIQAGGPMSSKIWANTVRIADNVSRFDIAVDVELSHPDSSVAQVCYDFLQQVPKKDRRRKIELYKGHTGDTLYIGSRKSNKFGRLYDKSGERGMLPGRTWRYEVELKSGPATQVTDTLLEKWEQRSNSSETMGDLICQTVYRFFSDREVEPLFDHKGRGIKMMEIKTETSLGQKLLWLRGQVRPSVQKLVEAGYGQEVMQALGFADPGDLLSYDKPDSNVVPWYYRS